MRSKRIDELKPEYRTRELIWNYGLKWALEKIFMKAWKGAPLVAYPLALDFAFGTLKYHYFRYGPKSVWMRLMNYNHVIVARITGEKTEDFKDLLTKEGQYLRVLDNEMDALEQQDY
jgi:hypothetical protein